MTTIPSQLPQLIATARTGTLQALALQSGQMLDAKIVGAAPNGGMQVEIRGQLLNLILPVPVKVGETIQLQVQGTGRQMKLAVQAAMVPSGTPVSPAPATQASLTPPATQVTVQSSAGQMAPVPQSPAALPVSLAAPAQPQAATLATAASQPALPATQAALPPLYPQSSGNPNPAAVAHTSTALPQPAAAAPTVNGAVRPVLAPTAAGGATSNPLPGNGLPQASTPQAALSQMVHASVQQQGSVTALTSALTAIAGKVVLPEPVAKAAQQVLAGRVAIDASKFDGAGLQAAIRGSGVFQEASLAQGQLPLPQTDMKSALLALRQTLTTWLGQQAPATAVAQIAPPLKGSIPRARGAEAPPFDTEAASEEVGKQLLGRTDAALARTRLHQHASLPDLALKTADWSMDLPVLIGQHQTLMQFQIHRDQHTESETVSERGWQMRFAINLPGMGEVGAQVSLRAGTTGVMLWASEPEASSALDSEVALLREALAAADLKLGAVIVRHGEPPVPAPAPSGHFVDARS